MDLTRSIPGVSKVGPVRLMLIRMSVHIYLGILSDFRYKARERIQAMDGGRLCTGVMKTYPMQSLRVIEE